MIHSQSIQSQPGETLAPGIVPGPPIDPNTLPGLTMPNGLEVRAYQVRIISQAVDSFARCLGVEIGPGVPPVEKVLPARQSGGPPPPAAASVLVESPTGSGKTVMGLRIAQWAQRHLGMSVGWCAMRRNLLGQAQAANRSMGFDVQMARISMFDKNPPSVDLLIIDEAHHDGALSMANLHSQIKPKLILGLTATPFRADKVKLCFGRVLRDAGIHSLIQDGYLSPYHHYTLPHYEPTAVAGAYLAEPERWGRSLMFFHRIEQCREAQALLAEAGVPCEVVTSSTDRERQLDDFTAGRVQVLINMLILAEGFDDPGLQTVFCRPSGKGTAVQMAGRAFRKHPDLPYKQIVQCQATRHPITRTASPARQFLWVEGQWRSLDLNDRLETVSKRMLNLVAQTRTELPQYIKRHRGHDVRPWWLARV
jgi:hypothetical protein